MSSPLRGDELASCPHRIVLSRRPPPKWSPPVVGDDIAFRREAAEGFRLRTLSQLQSANEHVVATSWSTTRQALEHGAPLIVTPRLADDVVGRRRAQVHALVRVGRHGDHFCYVPLLIKNAEFVERSTTRRLDRSSLSPVGPQYALEEPVAPRSSLTVTRTVLSLAHTTRVLEALGHADPRSRVGVVDRRSNVWWWSLSATDIARLNMAHYDEAYLERRRLLEVLDETTELPTAPFWHRECEECPFRAHCHAQLAEHDDVSLVRFTNFSQQVLLHQHGVATRRDLARLDPHVVATYRQRADPPARTEVLLASSIERLEDLIYRARVDVTGSLLRKVASEDLMCPVGDVEVDVDMESFDERTYLWGAHVRGRTSDVDGQSGYVSFAEWGELNATSEAELFRRFWHWFSDLRDRTQRRGDTFRAYCFWAQAEDGAMNRAVAVSQPGGPTRADLDAFRDTDPRQWVDMHEVVKAQIQTEGPLGLKRLARTAGFEWRDDNPSGEASMRWYLEARRDHDGAQQWRQRILDYNEDDCRATMALRDWLNSRARLLAHRDDVTLL